MYVLHRKEAGHRMQPLILDLLADTLTLVIGFGGVVTIVSIALMGVTNAG